MKQRKMLMKQRKENEMRRLFRLIYCVVSVSVMLR
jgi:hypothetical protein